jgi:nucleotide-binding universal stress UspA family protein
VGVDIPERAETVLRAAAAEARNRGDVLHVLHTWSFPSAYDDIMLSRPESEEWAARGTGEIGAALDALDDDMTGVPVRIDVRHTFAADALVEASRESELLVIGRHDPLVPIGSHLGPIARAVLGEADCPVLLADPRPARRWKRHSGEVEDTAAQPV